MKGYEALRTSAAWLDLSARGKIKLTGEDRARLLHAMTTNHIQQLTPGTGCYAFFLNDKGRILSDANILCRPDHFLLDLEPEERAREPEQRHARQVGVVAVDVGAQPARGLIGPAVLDEQFCRMCDHPDLGHPPAGGRQPAQRDHDGAEHGGGQRELPAPAQPGNAGQRGAAVRDRGARTP